MGSSRIQDTPTMRSVTREGSFVMIVDRVDRGRASPNVAKWSLHIRSSRVHPSKEVRDLRRWERDSSRENVCVTLTFRCLKRYRRLSACHHFETREQLRRVERLGRKYQKISPINSCKTRSMTGDGRDLQWLITVNVTALETWWLTSAGLWGIRSKEPYGVKVPIESMGMR